MDDDSCRYATAWQVRQAAGEPKAVVRVNNLQSVTSAGQDAWGRRGKAQPLLASIEVSFRSAFQAETAINDRLGTDTVHYGSLSKKALAGLKYCASGLPNGDDMSLGDLMRHVWADLTGSTLTGRRSYFAFVRTNVSDRPVLHLDKISLLSMTFHLPKASLLGEGVSLTASSTVPLDLARSQGGAVENQKPTTWLSLCLRLLRLRVPTLIGVNANEREAKQIVMTTVEIDRLTSVLDYYVELESLIVKAMEESSFETLEALGVYLAKVVAKWATRGRVTDCPNFQIGIILEKPTAVPFAEAPAVEIRGDASDFATNQKPN